MCRHSFWRVSEQPAGRTCQAREGNARVEAGGRSWSTSARRACPCSLILHVPTSMKRILLIFLLALIPLQVAWSAEFCSAVVAGDLQTVSAVILPGVESNDTQPSSTFGDSGCCPACNFACTCSVAGPPNSLNAHLLQRESLPVRSLAPPRYRSHVPEGPTRPNWTTAS